MASVILDLCVFHHPFLQTSARDTRAWKGSLIVRKPARGIALRISKGRFVLISNRSLGGALISRFAGSAKKGKTSGAGLLR